MTKTNHTESMARDLFSGSFGSGLSDSEREILFFQLGEQVQIRQSKIWFGPLDTAYFVPLEYLDTPEKLLRWTYHLTEKRFMTPAILRYTLLVVSEHFGYDLANLWKS